MSKTINRKILREMILKEITEDVPARAKRLAAEVAELIRNDKTHFTPALVTLLKTSMPYQSSEFEVTKLSDGIRKKMSSEIEYITRKIPGLEKLDVYQVGKIITTALKNLHESKEEQKIRKTLREMIIKELRYLKRDS
jgi:hypothetical protein